MDAKQELPDGLILAEQEISHQGCTVEYGLLSQMFLKSIDEDVQCLKEGDGLSPSCSSPASSTDSKHDSISSIEIQRWKVSTLLCTWKRVSKGANILKARVHLDATLITSLPSLFWRHFLRDVTRDTVDQKYLINN